MAPLPPREPAPTDPGSARQTQPSVPSQTQTQTQTRAQTQPVAILRLRGGHNPTARSVQWSEDVVDNEGLGRKKSKVCCIYHRPKGVDESSDESSSDSSSSSDSESDGGGPPSSSPEKQRSGGGGKGRPSGRKHAPDCEHSRDHGSGRRPEQGDGSRRRRPSPNAYEKMPKYKPKDQGGAGSGSAGQGGAKPASSS